MRRPQLQPPPRAGTSSRAALKWGGREFPVEGVYEGICRISGITGSGKTHLLKLHICDVLREVESNPHAKLVVYEPKREFYAWLSSLGLKSKIHYFMPSDTRSVPLDLREDYNTDVDALTLAHSFYPELPSSRESSFWGNCYRTIFASVYLAILKKLGRVDLRLVLLVLEDRELLEKVLGVDPYLVQARTLSGNVDKSPDETKRNVEYTFAARIFAMKSMAAHMDAAAVAYKKRGLEPFSLRRFIENPDGGVLVISKDETFKHSHDPMNGVLFDRFTQLMDAQQHDPRRKLFVVIDEFPTLCGDGRCPGVKSMFLRLRSRGAMPLIADQGKSSLKPIYEGDTEALIGQCTNTIFLRQPDHDSAVDAANILGRERGYEKKKSASFGGGGTSISSSVHPYDRSIVEDGKLTSLPLASKEEGIQGWAVSAHDKQKRPWEYPLPPGVVDAIPGRDERIPEYSPRPRDSQRLKALKPEEREQLLRTELSSLDMDAVLSLLGG